MVQILPHVPGFGERLIEQFTNAGQKLGEGYLKGRTNQKDNDIISGLTSNPNATPLQQIQAFAGLSPERQTALSPLFQQHFKGQQAQQAEQAKVLAKQQEEALKGEQENKGITDSLDALDKDLKYTGARLPFSSAFFGGVPGTEAFEKRAQFDNLGFLTADKVFTKFNKGTITKEKLDIIKNDLAPRSDLTQRTNKARIKALKIVMGLPDNVSEKKLDSTLKSAMKGVPEEKERPPLESFYQ